MILAADSQASNAWLPVLGTLGGVALTGVITLVAAMLNHRWQREAAALADSREIRRTLRQERIDIYSKFLDASRQLYTLLESLPPLHLTGNVPTPHLAKLFGADFVTALNNYNAAVNAVHLTAKGDVRQEATRMEGFLLRCIRLRAFEGDSVSLPNLDDAELPVIEAMRRELTMNVEEERSIVL